MYYGKEIGVPYDLPDRQRCGWRFDHCAERRKVWDTHFTGEQSGVHERPPDPLHLSFHLVRFDAMRFRAGVEDVTCYPNCAARLVCRAYEPVRKSRAMSTLARMHSRARRCAGVWRLFPLSS
jgi:hypothetical protein